VARRARAARARKPKSCATSCGTSSTTPCAASSMCSSFMCHLRAGVGGGLASGLPRAAAYLFYLKGCVRRVLYVLALHVSTATVLGLPRRHRGDDRGGELQGLVFSTLHTPARALFYDAAKLFLNAPTRASNVQRSRDDEDTVVDRVRVAAQHAFFGFRRSKMTRATLVAAAVVVTNLARGGEGGGRAYEEAVRVV